MSRRILIDKVFDDTMIQNPKPDASTRMLREPLIGTDNKARCSFLGASERVFNKHNLQVKVSKGGSIVSNLQEMYGPRFKVKLDDLTDRDGNSYLDDTSWWMGKETALYAQRTWELYFSDDEDPTVSPRMCAMKRSLNYDEEYGIAGFMVALTREPGGGPTYNWDVLSWMMKVYDTEPAGTTAGAGFIWEDATGLGTAIGTRLDNMTSGQTPACDVCELPDGSLIFVVLRTDIGWAFIFKSFDSGNTWTYESQIDCGFTGTTSKVSVGIEVVGQNVVFAWERLYNLSATDRKQVCTYVSFDLGYTWTTAYQLYSSMYTAGINDGCFIDMLLTRDGFLHMNWIDLNNSNVTSSTWNGMAWDSGVQDYIIPTGNGSHGLSCVEAHSGLLIGYWIDSSAAVPRGIRISDSMRRPPYFFHAVTGDFVLYDGEVTDINAVMFNDGGFIDLAFVVAGNDDCWTLQVFRLAMWSGIQIGMPLDTTVYMGKHYVRIWANYVHPSLADSLPNQSYWSRASGGGATSALVHNTSPSTYGGYLRISKAAVSANLTYYKTGFSDFYDTTVILRFITRVQSYGMSVVRIIAASAGSNAEVDFYVKINPSAVFIYDNKAGSIIAAFTPTNWLTTDWNLYTVIYSGDSVKVARSPANIYHEISPEEQILETGLLSHDAYSADNDQIEWGTISDLSYYNGHSDWRLFAFANELNGLIPSTEWDGDEWIQGAHAHSEPCGILQGIAARFYGGPLVKEDTWDLDTGEIHGIENIFAPSPSVMWKEPPVDGVDISPEHVFSVLKSDDDFGKRMRAKLDGYALFGRNWYKHKIEGIAKDALGNLSYTTLFDTAATGKGYLVAWEVATAGIDKNVIKVWPQSGSPATFEPMIPNQFASDGWRNYYVSFTSGLASGDVYKILANTEDKLFLESNLAEASVAAGDHFVIFGSSFFHYFASPGYYEGYRFTIYTQYRAPSERSLQLGTLIAGELIELPPDEWGYQVTLVPATISMRARSGYEELVQIGRLQRSLSLRYSGLQDGGPAIVSPVDFYRFIESGARPLVWVEDDSPIRNDPTRGFHEPIIARVTRAPRVTQLSYIQDTSDNFGEGNVIRNVVNVDDFILSEVL